MIGKGFTVPHGRAKAVLLAGMAALLTACGSDGEAGSATITIANAQTIAREVYATNRLDQGYVSWLGAAFIQTVIDESSMIPAGNAAATSLTVNCELGGTVLLSSNETRTEISAEFVSCEGFTGQGALDELVLDGRLHIQLAADNSPVGIRSVDVEYRMQLQNFLMNYDGQLISLDGDYAFRIRNQPDADAFVDEIIGVDIE